jgi:hypothetical protein
MGHRKRQLKNEELIQDTAPGKEAFTMDTEESATVPSATAQVQLDMEISLTP